MKHEKALMMYPMLLQMRDSVLEQEALVAVELGLQKLDKFDTEHHVFYENRCQRDTVRGGQSGKLAWDIAKIKPHATRGLKAWWNNMDARDEGARKEQTYFHGRFSRDAG